MSVRQVAIRVLAFAIPVALVGAGVPALRAATGAGQRSVRPAASGSDTLPGGPTAFPVVEKPDPLPVRAPNFIGEDLFDVTLPPGWSGGEIDNTGRAEGGHDAKRVWRYTNDAGDFFVVATDPDGSDYGSDQTWHYSVQDGAFRLARVHRCPAMPDDPFCGLGDDRLDVLIIWEEGGSATVAGHTYFFLAGNEHDEESSTDPYKDILESIRPR